MKIKDMLLFGLVAFVVLLSMYIIPPVIQGDVKALSVLSGSMEPVMNVGDLVTFYKADPEEVKNGDVIVFKDPQGRENVLITHRIVECAEEEGGFRTKGDANEDPDIFVVKPEDVVGKPVFLLPSAGYLFGSVGSKRPFVWFLLVILPASLIIAGEIKNIFAPPSEAWKKEKEKRRVERKKRVKVYYKRFLFLLLIFSIPFLILSAPSLANCGSVCIGEDEIKNEGLMPSVVVFERIERSVPYVVLPPGNITEHEPAPETENEIPTSATVSHAPYILPVFWIVQLAAVNPFLPALVTALAPPLIISLILYPVWLKDMRKRRKKKRWRLR